MSNNNYKQDIKSFVRIKEIEYNPKIVEGNFDSMHLSQVHAYIFQDSPELSPGKFRHDTENWFKKRQLESEKIYYSVPYLRGKQISKNLTQILNLNFEKLSKIKPEDFCHFFTNLYAQLDFTHPFLEGNSRTLRTFTRLLAKKIGYNISWNTTNANAVTRDTLYKARDIEVINQYYCNKLDDNYLSCHDFKSITEYELAFSAYKGYISIIKSKKLIDLIREEVIQNKPQQEIEIETINTLKIKK